MSAKQKAEHALWRTNFLKKRKENPFRVLELGTGPRAKKAVDLALKHSAAKITAIDHNPNIEHTKYLRSLSKTKPGNLTIKAKQDALNYLKSEKKNHYDHIYTHFLLQHLSYAKRMAICRRGRRFPCPLWTRISCS